MYSVVIYWKNLSLWVLYAILQILWRARGSINAECAREAEPFPFCHGSQSSHQHTVCFANLLNLTICNYYSLCKSISKLFFLLQLRNKFQKIILHCMTQKVLDYTGSRYILESNFKLCPTIQYMSKSQSRAHIAQLWSPYFPSRCLLISPSGLLIVPPKTPVHFIRVQAFAIVGQ